VLVHLRQDRGQKRRHESRPESAEPTAEHDRAEAGKVRGLHAGVPVEQVLRARCHADGHEGDNVTNGNAPAAARRAGLKPDHFETTTFGEAAKWANSGFSREYASGRPFTWMRPPPGH
jgi:hypothetical protein